MEVVGAAMAALFFFLIMFPFSFFLTRISMDQPPKNCGHTFQFMKLESWAHLFIRENPRWCKHDYWFAVLLSPVLTALVIFVYVFISFVRYRC